MNNHEFIRKCITDKTCVIKKVFTYRDIMLCAKNCLADVTPAGKEYATLRFIQNFCDKTDSSDSATSFFSLKDPRKYHDLVALKESWAFVLKGNEVPMQNFQTNKMPLEFDAWALLKILRETITILEKKGPDLISGLTSLWVSFPGKVPKKYLFSEKQYPPIRYSISKDELYGHLGDNGELIIGEETLGKATPLEKLLYSVIWKNGDLLKIQHIVDGVLAGESTPNDDKNNGLVFYSFGKHLHDKKYPIIDQHTVRAYELIVLLKKCSEDSDFIAQWQNFAKNSKISMAIVKEYCNWIEVIRSGIDDQEAEKNKVVSLVDKILFSIGKAAKPPKNIRMARFV